jgi:hypothetical protein
MAGEHAGNSCIGRMEDEDGKEPASRPVVEHLTRMEDDDGRSGDI